MEKEAKTYPFIEEMPLAEEPSSNNGDGTKKIISFKIFYMIK